MMATRVRLDRGCLHAQHPSEGAPAPSSSLSCPRSWFIVTLGTEAVRIQGTSTEDGTPLIYQHLGWEAGRDPHSTNKGESSAK